jgi:hypothetical protein
MEAFVHRGRIGLGPIPPAVSVTSGRSSPSPTTEQVREKHAQLCPEHAPKMAQVREADLLRHLLDAARGREEQEARTFEPTYRHVLVRRPARRAPEGSCEVEGAECRHIGQRGEVELGSKPHIDIVQHAPQPTFIKPPPAGGFVPGPRTELLDERVGPGPVSPMLPGGRSRATIRPEQVWTTAPLCPL